MSDEIKPFSVFDTLGEPLPMAWEPIEAAPVNLWPVLVLAVPLCQCEKCRYQTWLLAGGRFDGKWSFTTEVPSDLRLVEFFRPPVPASILKDRAN